jgi:hypothetical protein
MTVVRKPLSLGFVGSYTELTVGYYPQFSFLEQGGTLFRCQTIVVDMAEGALCRQQSLITISSMTSTEELSARCLAMGMRAARTAHAAYGDGLPWLVSVFGILKHPQMTGVVGCRASRNVRPMFFPLPTPFWKNLRNSSGASCVASVMLDRIMKLMRMSRHGRIASGCDEVASALGQN